MVWIEYDEYRGQILYYSDTDPKLYWTPLTVYPTDTEKWLKDSIDEKLGPEVPPEPEPPKDYLADTYEGIEIWWLEGPQVFRAYIAGWGTAVTETLEEIYPYIDGALEWLEPPEEPEKGGFAQVVAEVKAWVNTNITDRLQPVYDWVDGLFADAEDSTDDKLADVSGVIAGVSGALTSLAKGMGDRWDTFTTDTLPSVWDTITTQATALQDTIDLKGTELEELMGSKLVDFTVFVRGLLVELDPHKFLPDPEGFIGVVFNTLIAPWVEGIVKSFSEGLEEGLEE